MSDDPVLAALERLEAGQKSLRAEFLDELGKTRSDIMSRVAELKGEVMQIRDDISVDMGGIDAARQANDNTRDDVRQMREQVSVGGCSRSRPTSAS